ncbi:TPA: winged helix-turn-helix domain-containing protein, partial [Klebsiella oxytoca]|nr:winged helix-turn-helix domain-containing protein [Klebsiella oxytoca]
MEDFPIIDGYFIIDTDVRFTPVTREIVKEGGTDTIILQTPASLCLTLLLNRQGQLLHRDELLSYAWGRDAARFINNNNYYQTISYLRKTLASIGCDNLIQTVPKKGLMIGNSIKIDYFSSDPTRSSEHLMCNEDNPTHKKKKRLVVGSSYLFAVLILAGLILTYVSFNFSKGSNNAFIGYHKTSLNSCT